MYQLDTTTKKFQFKFGESDTTASMWESAYIATTILTSTVISIASSDGTSNGTTAVSVTPNPGTGTSITMKHFSLYNADNIPHTFEWQLNDNSTIRTVFTETIPAGGSIICDETGAWHISNTANGNVTGPSSSTNTAVALWNGTSGTSLENSVVTIDASGNLTGVHSITAGSSSPNLLLSNFDETAQASFNNDGFGGGQTSLYSNELTFTMQDHGNLFQFNSAVTGTVIDAGTMNITDMADPVNPQDAATKNYVDTHAGNVTGPSSSTSGAIAIFSDLSGKVLTSSFASIDEYGDISTGGTIATPEIYGETSSGSGVSSLIIQAGPDQTVPDITMSYQTSTNLGLLELETVNLQLNLDDTANQFVFIGDGSSSINAGTMNIINVVNPINPQDAATKNYVDTRGVPYTGATSTVDLNNQNLTDVQSLAIGLTSVVSGNSIDILGNNIHMQNNEGGAQVYLSATDADFRITALNAGRGTVPMFINPSGGDVTIGNSGATDLGYACGVVGTLGVSGKSSLIGGAQPGNGTNITNSSTMYSGSGAPSGSLGVSGDYYFRSDTPTVSNQRIYVNQSGTWVGIL